MTEQRLKAETELIEIDKGGYEYRAKLLDTKYSVILDEFHSLHECHRPNADHLTEPNAKSTMQKIENDVKNGDADKWFDFELD